MSQDADLPPVATGSSVNFTHIPGSSSPPGMAVRTLARPASSRPSGAYDSARFGIALLPEMADEPAPLTDVRELSRLAYGFMASKALFAALDLELFDHLASAPAELSQLVEKTGVPANRLACTQAQLHSGAALR